MTTEASRHTPEVPPPADGHTTYVRAKWVKPAPALIGDDRCGLLLPTRQGLLLLDLPYEQMVEVMARIVAAHEVRREGV